VQQNKRGALVDKFNNLNTEKVFMLSAKAGGVGLNLVRANRIILFDPDWNPATDLQSLARVWREGQKKHVYAYRFFTTGTIEEKILQRQMSKSALSDNAIDQKLDGAKFTNEDLKRIFSLNSETSCETLEYLSGQDLPWTHQSREVERCTDVCLTTLKEENVSFVGWKTMGKRDAYGNIAEDCLVPNLPEALSSYEGTCTSAAVSERKYTSVSDDESEFDDLDDSDDLDEFDDMNEDSKLDGAPLVEKSKPKSRILCSDSESEVELDDDFMMAF